MGGYGSFVGGVLSPIFSILGLIYVVKSIESSNRNSSEQLEKMDQQYRLDYISRLLHEFNRHLEVNVVKPEVKRKLKRFKIWSARDIHTSFPSCSVNEAILDFVPHLLDDPNISDEYYAAVDAIMEDVVKSLELVLFYCTTIESDDEFIMAMKVVESNVPVRIMRSFCIFYTSLLARYRKDAMFFMFHLHKINERTCIK